MSKALIIAHYHQKGLLRSDTKEFISKAVNYFDDVIFVSTNLGHVYEKDLPKRVKIIVRENKGYDFFSYKLGIQALYKNNWGSMDELTIINTSFIISDIDLLFENYFKKLDGIDFVSGLTVSREIEPHIQSYLMSFPKAVLSNPRFIAWWEELVVIRNKKLLIKEYEVGLSVFLIHLGFILNPIYKCSPGCGIHNPAHVHYLDLLDTFGVLKIELFKKNPVGLSLKEINDRLKNDVQLLERVKEGLEN